MRQLYIKLANWLSYFDEIKFALIDDMPYSGYSKGLPKLFLIINDKPYFVIIGDKDKLDIELSNWVESLERTNIIVIISSSIDKIKDKIENLLIS